MKKKKKLSKKKMSKKKVKGKKAKIKKITKKREKEKTLIEKEIAKMLIDVAIGFGKEKKGALFIVSNKDLSNCYKSLYPDLFSKRKVNIKDKSAMVLLKKLAELDGAVIIDEDGDIKTYGAQVTKTYVFRGHGTRHSAALGISQVPGVISIASSEEDGCVRIFREGITVIEINPLTRTPPTLSQRIADIITSAHLPVIGGGGLASIALGINPVVAAIVFTGSYIATKSGIKSLSDFLRHGKIPTGKESEEKKKK